jgi:hypothetical protein
MPIFAERGRHRGTGHGRYLTHPRHAAPTDHHIRLGVTIGTLTVANVVAGGLLVHQDALDIPAASRPLPTITIPVPPTAAASANRSPHRAERRQAKPRPIRLGTVDLAAFCRDAMTDSTGARMTPDGWDCERLGGTARAVSMNSACAWQYGSEAWGGMLNDDDQRTWRCYRDPS